MSRALQHSLIIDRRPVTSLELWSAAERVRITEDHLQVRIAGVAPSSIPVEALNSHLIVPAFLDAPLSVCWVRYVAPDRESVWAASSAAMGLTPVIISDFFPVTPDSLTSEALWDRYISALPSVLAGFVAIALAGV